MKRKNFLSVTTALVTTSLLWAPTTPVLAQEATIEEIVITGSYIRRQSQFDSPSPITVVGSEHLDAIGATTIADITQTLTINTGAQNNPDAFTQNATTGTSNINLRGLGVASTLVLLNGKRQVLTGVTTNDGVSFVDTSSLVPAIAIDRVEIVKDGAAALYGSDAVAGVANFITRDNFSGAEISAQYQFVTDQGSQEDILLQGIVGGGNDTTHLMAAFSYTDRTGLTTAERRLSRTQDDTSALGNPGSFFGVPPAVGGAGFIPNPVGAPLGIPVLPTGVPVIDPTGCASVGGFPTQASPTAPPPVTGIGFCGFDFGDFFNLVPEETRFTGYAKATHQISGSIEFWGEFGFSRNRTIRGNSPTFPVLTFPIVPASNPGNVFGVPVAFFGRAIGNGGEVTQNRFTSDTYRVAAGLSGQFSDSWYWELSYTRGINDFSVTTQDTLAEEFQNALNGFGGQGCAGPTNPAALPGVGSCLFFNPFATSFGPIPNDPAVFDSFLADQVVNADSDITVVDAVVSGELFDLPAGPIGIALGGQIRDERLSQDFDGNSNGDAFAFLIGNPDFADSRDVVALFAELAIPVMDSLDLQAAVRFEDYGGTIGDTVDPKVALIARPAENITLRGSWSTSFRAPSIFQVVGTQTSLQQVLDPITGGTFFAAVRSTGTPAIRPETSTAYNFGMSLEPVPNLVFNVDYWNFDFDDVIIREDQQAVLNAFPQDPTRVIRAINPLFGPVVQINTLFVNASSVETSGLDLSAYYTWEGDFGTLRTGVEGTFIANYDIVDPQAGRVEGKGKRNFTNFGSPTPQWRLNASMELTTEHQSANVFVRYIDSFEDDQNPGRKVGSHVTVDAQYSLSLGAFFESGENKALTIGAVNLFDNTPPQVFTNGGFESRVHDPRGRLLYLKLVSGF
ncbi:MAG: TonB-dependent receptor plug domain-containing protein [Sphingomonadales bacterium]